jgi:hypothetical protein
VDWWGQNPYGYSSTVNNSYATGNVTGDSDIGGLVGINGGTVSTSYATGSASGSSNIGGLIGATTGLGTVSNSFWNVTTSGLTTSAVGIGMTTAEMKTQANFTSATSANDNKNPEWNFTSIWYMTNGVTYPQLQALVPAQAVAAADEACRGCAEF